MGGGGAMRAAAKVAGIGVSSSGLRGFTPMPAAEQAIRNTVHPVSTTLTSSQQNLKAASDDASYQRTSWEVDDWEFAGGKEDMVFNSGEPLPRVVFGGAPTLQEAKEATYELKDALDEVYAKPTVTNQLLGQSVASEYGDKGLDVVSDSITAPPVTKHAFQAFSLLRESPAAQNVVAAIASDPNVWNAVLQNEALTEYINSHKIYTPSHGNDLQKEESVADADFQDKGDLKKCEDSSNASQSGDSETTFTDVLHNIKVTVMEMVSGITDFVQNIFGVSEVERKSSDCDGKPVLNFAEKTVGVSSLMGLAVMVIAVILLKRS